MDELLVLKGLSTGFEGRTVSPGVDLTVGRGQLITLIGPNGCGKTTLLKTIAGLIPKKGGQMLVKGRDASSLGRKEAARMISYLPQSRATPDITAEALISHGRFPHLGFSRKLTAEDRRVIEASIDEAGVSELRHKRLPNMSGGERQRVYLAMTIAQNADIVLLDEPGTYLDIGSRFYAAGLALALAERGAAVIMTMHELSDAMYFSPRLCLMDRAGQLVFDGDAQGLYASGLLKDIFGVDSGVAETPDGKRAYYFLPAK